MLGPDPESHALALRKMLRESAAKVLEDNKWSQFRDIIVRPGIVDPTSGGPLILPACFIDLRDFVIQIHAPLHLDALVQSVIDKHKLDYAMPTAIDTMMHFAVTHEHGHFKYCPRDADGLKKLLRGAYRAVKPFESDTQQIQQFCFTLNNLYSDTVLNSINAHESFDPQKYRKGYELFYLMRNYAMAELGKSQKGIGRFFSKRKAMDKGMMLFINTNLDLDECDPAMRERINSYRPFYFPSYERNRKRVLTTFTKDQAGSESIALGTYPVDSWSKLMDRIGDKSLWEESCYEYSCVMYRFMRPEYPDTDNSFSRGGSQSKQQRQGKGKGQGKGKSQGAGQETQPESGTGQGQGQDQKNPPGKDKKDQAAGGGGKDEKDSKDKKDEAAGGGGKDEKDAKDKKDGGQGDDRKTKNEDPREKGDGNPLRKALEDFLDGVIDQPSGGTGRPSPLLYHYDRIDSLYRQRAGKLRIEAQDPSRISFSDPLYLGTDEMDPAEFNPSGIEWGETRMISVRDPATGKRAVKHLELFQKEFPIDLGSGQGISHFGVPDLSFIFDSSASDTFDPFKGIGEYHYATQAFYSMIDYLEEIGIAPLLKYNMINFSNRTVESGWHPYAQMPAVKRAIFDYQGGCTALDPRALERLRKGRTDSFLCFILTDGGINYDVNSDAVLAELDMMHKTGSIGIHAFNLGGSDCYFWRGFRKLGLKDQPVRNAQDFLDKAVKFTKEFYSEVE